MGSMIAVSAKREKDSLQTVDIAVDIKFQQQAAVCAHLP